MLADYCWMSIIEAPDSHKRKILCISFPSLECEGGGAFPLSDHYHT